MFTFMTNYFSSSGFYVPSTITPGQIPNLKEENDSLSQTSLSSSLSATSPSTLSLSQPFNFESLMQDDQERERMETELVCDQIVKGSQRENGKVSLDDFSLLKVIGKGSYGKVLLVKKKGEEEGLAMKVLKKQELQMRGQSQHTKTERSILEHTDNPFIVSMKYAFQTPKKLYFVLEYCPGTIKVII